MSNKQYIGLIILIVAIFGVMFYWYAVRPSIIKKRCGIQAMEMARQKHFNRENYEAYYKALLHNEGL